MIESISYILEAVKFIVIYRMGFSVRWTKDGKKWIAVLCMAVIMGLRKKNDVFNYVYPAVYLIFIAVTVYLIFGEYIRKNIIILLWSVGVVLSVDSISYVLVRILADIMNYMLSAYQELYMSLITIIILSFLFGFISYYGKTRLNELSKGYFIIFLLICVFNAAMLAVIFEDNFLGIQRKYAGIYLFLVLGSLIQMAFVLVLASSNMWHRKNEELKEKYLELQTGHYRYLKERNLDTKKFRHDLRAHMHVMKKYIYEENLKELGSYIDTICGKLENISGYISVKNETVDAVLNYYNNSFLKKGIKFKVTGSMPQECRINTLDLCIVFSNILSNAIENTDEVDGEAKLNIHFDEDMIYIREQNTFGGTLKKNGKEIKTTKDDEWLHGFGIQNIKDSVRKYSGSVDIEAKDKIFVIDIVMENREV